MAQPADRLEWCERRLLARIHRRSLEDLRRQVEPVSPAALMRFCVALASPERRACRKARSRCGPAIERLQGFVAPAAAWERDLLPARSPGLSGLRTWTRCSQSGDFTWLRRGSARARGPARCAIRPLRWSPREVPWLHWRGALPRADRAGRLTGRATAGAVQKRCAGDGRRPVFCRPGPQPPACCATAGGNCSGRTGGRGLVTCDSFGGLRASDPADLAPGEFLACASQRVSSASMQRRALEPGASARGGASAAGRRDAQAEAVAPGCCIATAWYSVALLSSANPETAAALATELVRALRRLEARGEIRGGRFVNGFRRRAVCPARCGRGCCAGRATS